MAVVQRNNTASVDTQTAMTASQISGLTAGEDIDGVAPCYIKAADGKAYMSDGTAANEAARVDGISAQSCRAGQGITLLGPGVRAGYGSGLTVGDLYLAATKGRFDTAPTVGGQTKIARIINSTDIQFRAWA